MSARRSEDPRILVTGAAGGIGRATSLALAGSGASLALVDRDGPGVQAVCEEIRAAGGKAHAMACDLSEISGLEALVDDAAAALGGLDVLVNNAGLLSFCPFEEEGVAELQRLVMVNFVAPMALARHAARRFRSAGSGCIVNVGSIFGSIGFPYFAAYSATKFALRGLSESLRRELVDTGVHVVYVAPRATRTRLADSFGEMAQATKMNLDEPEVVAGRIVRALHRRRARTFLGRPESFFVRLNAVLPGLVDRALGRQGKQMRPFAMRPPEPGADAGERPPQEAGPEPIVSGLLRSRGAAAQPTGGAS